MAERAKINTCQTCDFPIYRGDKMHYSTKGTRAGVYHYGFSRGVSHSDRWVQCQWCISEWSKESIKLNILNEKTDGANDLNDLLF